MGILMLTDELLNNYKRTN